MQCSHSLDTVLLYTRRSVPVLVDKYHEHRTILIKTESCHGLVCCPV
jgi:hypothetical protein